MHSVNTGRTTTTTRSEWVHLYPFHHVEVDDCWSGVYEGVHGWRGVFAELLGTMMYTFISAGLFIAVKPFGGLLPIALGDGLAFMCLMFTFQRLSGGHLNPAITWAAMITRRIGILKGVAYMLAQVSGALLGALLISAATPDNYHKHYDSTEWMWNDDLTKFDGFLLIASLSAILIFVVFATHFDPLNIGKTAPIPVGFTVVFVNLVGYIFVGPPVNPARTFGTAVVYNVYRHHWLYWVGPLAGSTLAALVYTLLFLTRPIPASDILLSTPAKHTHTTYTVPAYTTTETTRLMGSGTV